MISEMERIDVRDRGKLGKMFNLLAPTAMLTLGTKVVKLWLTRLAGLLAYSD